MKQVPPQFGKGASNKGFGEQPNSLFLDSEGLALEKPGTFAVLDKENPNFPVDKEGAAVFTVDNNFASSPVAPVFGDSGEKQAEKNPEKSPEKPTEKADKPISKIDEMLAIGKEIDDAEQAQRILQFQQVSSSQPFQVSQPFPGTDSGDGEGDDDDGDQHSKKDELLSIFQEMKEENAINEMRECVKVLQTVYFDYKGKKFTGRFIMELVEELTKEFYPNTLEHNRFKAVDFLTVFGWVVRGLFLLDLRYHKKYNPHKNRGVYRTQLIKVIPDKFHPMVDECLKSLKDKKMIKEFHHENGYFKVEHLLVLTPHGKKVMTDEHLYPPVKPDKRTGISLMSAVPTTFSNITITTSTMAPNATNNNNNSNNNNSTNNNSNNNGNSNTGSTNTGNTNTSTPSTTTSNKETSGTAKGK